MKWLLWKDYRVNRAVFITALLLLVGPHALMAIVGWRGELRYERWAEGFTISSCYSLALLQLALALLGGNSIAGERVDRSAEFLAYLPVSRGRILASKLLVALAAVPLVWLPNLVVLVIAYALLPPFHSAREAYLISTFGTIAVTGLTFFCVAWLFSCVLRSPTFSVCAGLIVPLLVASGILWVMYLLDLPHVGEGVWFLRWYWGLCLAISAASFPAGTIYYLRRVEP